MEIFTLSTKIIFGDNAIDRLKDIPYRRVLVVTDPFAAKSGMLDLITEPLLAGGAEYELFTDVVPDPPVAKVSLGVKKMMEYQPQAIVALGGGSAIDSAKGINKVYSQATGNPTVPMIAIPTTSGTGSEVTSFAVISDPAENRKYPLVSNDMLPAEAILDARLVQSVPANITANTGMDVLTHAIEAYVSVNHNDFADALAEKAIELCGKYLLRAYCDGNDLEARAKMHSASCLAGVAFNNVSLGVNHGIAHTLGAHYHIPHGLANAMLLPKVVEFNSGVYNVTSKYNPCARRYSHIANVLGIYSDHTASTVRALVNWLSFMLDEMNIPRSVSKCGVDCMDYAANIPNMIESALADGCTLTNPVKPTYSDIEKILRELY
ncbi:MAG: iron-containing alcohol dehydrogenase [Clostridia bacterium]|nr:iron-containing alcohol dehydrogenase [Clostridia bacterium]